MSDDFLQQMAASSRERLETARKRRSPAQVLEQAHATPEPPPLLASRAGFDLIAEVKLRSPAAGQLQSLDENVAARVTGYASAGAAAISVLTEPSRFDGSMAHLETAARALAAARVPVMRKDFLVDPYQIAEARAAGAGGVLIILRMLPKDVVEALLEQARALQLFVLTEAFDEQDIEHAHALVAKYGAERERVDLLVGVNCRDLVTLQVVPGRLEELAPLLPAGVPHVAESGVGSVEDARRVATAGYDFALVGSALMQAADPQALLSGMLETGRTVRRAAARGTSGRGPSGRGASGRIE